jgi:RNA polymerase-binding protein DksA
MNTDRFRIALLEERGRVESALKYLNSETDGAERDEASTELSTADNHIGDRASETFDRELDYTLEENAEVVIADIDRALARIEDGSYGTCERCGKEIPEERLEARPWANLCIQDQEKEDRGA